MPFLLSCAARTADTVYIAFRILRQVEVDDMRYAGYVQTPSGYVGCYQHIDAAVAELAHNGVALVLRQVAMEAVCGITAFLQRFGQFVYTALRAAEYNRQLRRFHIEETAQRLELLTLRNLDVGLVDQRCAHMLRNDGYMLRILQELGSQLLDVRRHRCGEQQGLAIFRYQLQDGLDIIHEAHVQHFIRFVQHDGLNIVKPDGLPVNVVKQSARCADNNLRLLFQSANLPAYILSAVNRKGADPFKSGQFADLFGNLNGELAGWRHDESDDPLFFFRDFVNKRKAECCGLTGTCLCLSDHVLSGEGNRDGLGLNRCRFFKSKFRNRLKHSGLQAKICKIFQ